MHDFWLEVENGFNKPYMFDSLYKEAIISKPRTVVFRMSSFERSGRLGHRANFTEDVRLKIRVHMYPVYLSVHIQLSFTKLLL